MEDLAQARREYAAMIRRVAVCESERLVSALAEV
jgi:hypothetical protein